MKHAKKHWKKNVDMLTLSTPLFKLGIQIRFSVKIYIPNWIITTREMLKNLKLREDHPELIALCATACYFIALIAFNHFILPEKIPLYSGISVI